MFEAPRTRRLATAIVALAALGIATLSPAVAADETYTVTAGSAPSGTAVPFAADTTGATPKVTFEDVDALGGIGFTLNCASGAMTGTTATGSSLTGTGIADASSLSWMTCTGPFSTSFDIDGSGALDATGPTSGGTTSVALTGAHLSWTGTCNFDLTGSIAGTFTNGTSTSTLTFPGTPADLVAENVSGAFCSLLGMANGDHWSYRATYDLSAENPANNPIHLTSD